MDLFLQKNYIFMNNRHYIIMVKAVSALLDLYSLTIINITHRAEFFQYHCCNHY